MAKSGGGDAKKAEEPQPHPVMDQLAGVQYCVNSPPPWIEALFLGFQHYVLTLGNTVLIPSMIVPIMGGNNVDKAKVIQTQLFVSGLSTLLQSLFGTRLPLVVGSSYSYLIPTMSILEASRYRKFEGPNKFSHTMRGVQGALLVASFFQMSIGYLGIWRNVVRFLSPLSIVPLVSFTGLGLYYLGFPMLAKCMLIGVPQMILMVVISQYVAIFVKIKNPICDRYAVLFCLSFIWIYAEILTVSGLYNDSTPASRNCRTDSAGLMAGAPWLYFPYPFQWGTPTFRVGEVVAMAAAALVASAESTGAFHAAARYGSATPIPPSIISRGVGWLGLGTMLNGVLGGVTGSTASVENVGLLGLTRVGSRRVAQISAGFMICLSVFGKFGAFFASIPLPIMAALNCVLFGYVFSVGVAHLQFCNLNSFRTKFILGLSFSLGLSVPQYFREYQLLNGSSPARTHARWFNDITTVIFMSHATVAMAVALLLDCTLPRGSDEHRKDSGCDWWQKFIVYGKDVRNDDFYKLPCNLNKLSPPL